MVITITTGMNSGHRVVKGFINARYGKDRPDLMGRHREFCVEKALDDALRVFWRKGYEGASYADLTEATGIERPALYSAFGNKEALFRLALARYGERYVAYIPEALGRSTSREVAAGFLYGAVDLSTRYPDHLGCFGVNGALACSDASEAIRQALVEYRATGEVALRTRFERARAEGDLPATADCATLAAYVMAMAHGLAVQAKAGFAREALRAVVEQALAGWPASKRPQKARSAS